MDFRWATPVKIAVGSLPKTREDVEQLNKLGIRAVLSLHPLAPSVRSFMSEAGIKQITTEMTDFSVPSELLMLQAKTMIDSWVSDGLPVYIHCYMGIGRSRTVACSYLVSTGLTPDEAFEKVGLPETPGQRQYVIEYAQRNRV